MSRKSQPAEHSPIRLRPEAYEVTLPALHDRQYEVYRDGARFKVVACGRQFGKTHLGAVLCVKSALEGQHVWWVAPTFDLTERGWTVIMQLCGPIPGVRTEGRPVWRVKMPNGGTIQARSADNPDSLRGATLDGLVFDECAQAKQEAWPILRPTLSIRRGWAMFISTPKGLNWFHDLYQSAGERPGWSRWRFPSTDSPFLPPDDIELAREEMSSLVFSQEYLAEFISAGSGMFRADWMNHYYTRFEGENKVYILGETAVAYDSCRRFHTVDLAWSLGEGADYTVISSWAVTPQKNLILLDVIRGHFEGPDIIPQMRRAFQTHGGYLAVERATRQMSIIQEANRQGLPIKEVRADKDKVARALPATARMEQGRIWFPPASTPGWRDLEEELLAFPAGRHDDFVDTLAYAVREASGGSYLAKMDVGGESGPSQAP